MRDWVETCQFHCAICGGIVPRYVWYEKEAFKQACLFPEEECTCAWKVALEEKLERLFSPSLSEGLQAFYRLMQRNGIPLRLSS